MEGSAVLLRSLSLSRQFARPVRAKDTVSIPARIL